MAAILQAAWRVLGSGLIVVAIAAQAGEPPVSDGSQIDQTDGWWPVRVPSPNDRPFYLGMKMTTAGKRAAVEVGSAAAAGAVVLRVEPRSPAERAGLRPGDVVTGYGPYAIQTVEDLVAAVSWSARTVPFRLTYSRGATVLQTEFLVEDRPEAPPLAWYVHPEGAYRVQLPTAWAMDVPDPASAHVTIHGDVLHSPDRMYRVDFVRRSTAAPVADRAFEAFVRERLQSNPEATVGRSTVGPVSVTWVASYQGQNPRVAVYDLAFCHVGRLYRISLAAPALSLLNKLPLPMRQLLSTLQIAAPAGTEPVSTPSKLAGANPSPPPGPDRQGTLPPVAPAGWGDVRLETLTLSIPPGLTPSDFVTPGDGVWFRGSELLPEVMFAVYHDTAVADLTRGGVLGPESEVSLGGYRAQQYAVDHAEAARPEKGLITMIRVAGRPVAIVGFARLEVWEQAAADYQKILLSLRPPAASLNRTSGDAP